MSIERNVEGYGPSNPNLVIDWDGYGRTPEDGELVEGKNYTIDGLAVTGLVCSSDLSYIPSSFIAGEEVQTLRGEDTVFLDHAEVTYWGYTERPCASGCGIIPHHTFAANIEGSGVVELHTMDGMFGISVEEITPAA